MYVLIVIVAALRLVLDAMLCYSSCKMYRQLGASHPVNFLTWYLVFVVMSFPSRTHDRRQIRLRTSKKKYSLVVSTQIIRLGNVRIVPSTVVICVLNVLPLHTHIPRYCNFSTVRVRVRGAESAGSAMCCVLCVCVIVLTISHIRIY